MAASLVVSLLLYIQIDQPEEVSEPLLRWCELASVSLECAAVPAYWVWETGKAPNTPHDKVLCHFGGTTFLVFQNYIGKVVELVEINRIMYSNPYKIQNISVSSSSGMWLSEFPRVDLEQEQHAEPEPGPTHGGLRS